jgi:mono/diheme cytochrome c family protein
LIAVLGVGVLGLVLQAPSSAPALAATGADAELLYMANCSGCHGANGQGAVNIAPPLAKNPYVTGDPKKVIQAMLGGVAGPINEHGATWNGSMPSWQGTLSNAQLAAVITYIRGSWGNNAKPVSEKQVALQAHAVSSSPRQTPSSAATSVATSADAGSLYLTNCSGCHGANGQGAVNIAPPLAKNPYVTGDPKRVIQAVLGGMAGPIKEHGATWNGSMPPWKGTLSNAQLAAVITYIRGSWGNKAKPVSEKQVAASSK